MLTVSLAGMRFNAPVGLYPQEPFVQNELEIHVSVARDASLAQLPFLDYAMLYTMVQSALAEPAQLLETVIQRIAEAITIQWPQTKISVSIRKLNPPMGGQIAYAEVKWDNQPAL